MAVSFGYLHTKGYQVTQRWRVSTSLNSPKFVGELVQFSSFCPLSPWGCNVSKSLEGRRFIFLTRPNLIEFGENVYGKRKGRVLPVCMPARVRGGHVHVPVLAVHVEVAVRPETHHAVQ